MHHSVADLKQRLSRAYDDLKIAQDFDLAYRLRIAESILARHGAAAAEEVLRDAIAYVTEQAER
jgi:hypothetical protein